MATKCINKLGNPEQYQRLKEHFKFSDGVLDAKIGVWQEQHNTDEFPTIEQMELYEKNRPKDTKVKPIASYSDEMNEIRAKAIANGTFMKAPNGNPTNLNERQWLQVRTKAFKDWFGDWTKQFVVYQGRVSEKDSRKFNYYTISRDEASSYGTNIESKVIDTTGMLSYFSDEFSKLREEFYKKTGKRFDILNNSKEGLQTQNEFFEFIQSKGYTGFEYLSEHPYLGHDFIENPYIVKFDNHRDSGTVSKVVDENGEPLVVYHHTDNPNLTEFSTDFDNYFSKDGGTKEAIFFDENETGTLNRKYDKAFFLNIRDLKEYNETKEQLHQRGTTYRQVVNESAAANNIDGGVHMKNFDDNKMEHQSIWIAHNPNQIIPADDTLNKKLEEAFNNTLKALQENEALRDSMLEYSSKALQKSIEEFCDRLGFTLNYEEDGSTVVDFINKTISVSEYDEHTYNELMARTAAVLMPNDLRNKIIKAGKKYGKETSDDLYLDILNALENKETWLQKEQGLLNEIKAFIKDLVNKIFKNQSYYESLIQQAAADISDTYSQWYTTRVAQGFELKGLSMEKLQQSPLYHIYDTLVNLGASLDGSAAVRLQGTLYRKDEEDFHDLDFTKPYDSFSWDVKNELDEFFNNYKIATNNFSFKDIHIYRDLRQQMLDNCNEHLKRSSIYKELSKHYSDIRVKHAGKSKELGLLVTLEVDGNSVDIFYAKEVKQHDIKGFKVTDFSSAFSAKLIMGRDKDIRDIINFHKYPNIQHGLPVLPSLKMAKEVLYQSYLNGAISRVDDKVEDIKDALKNTRKVKYSIPTASESRPYSTVLSSVKSQVNAAKATGLYRVAEYIEDKGKFYVTLTPYTLKEYREVQIEKTKQQVVNWVDSLSDDEILSEYANLTASNGVKINKDSRKVELTEGEAFIIDESYENFLIGKLQNLDLVSLKSRIRKESLVKLAQALFSYFKKNNIKVIFNNAPFSEKERDKSSSICRLDSNTYLLSYQKQAGDNPYLVVLHELLHIATMQNSDFETEYREIEDEQLSIYYHSFVVKLSKNPEFQKWSFKSLNAKSQEELDSIPKEWSQLIHASESASEFLSSFISYPRVQQEVSSTLYGEAKELFQELIRYIKDFLNKLFKGYSYIDANNVVDDITEFLLNRASFNIAYNFDRSPVTPVDTSNIETYSTLLNSKIPDGTVSEEFYTKVSVDDYINDLVADGIRREDIKVEHTPETETTDEYWTVSYNQPVTKEFDTANAEFYSGDADGADKAWGAEARALGIKVKDYTTRDWDNLSQEWKDRLDGEYQEVVSILNRKVLDKNSYRGKLVRRDMMQADKADAVFAIGTIGTNGYVNGGTAYATTRGIQRGIPVYVFDQSDNKWKVWDKNTNSFVETEMPTLTPHAATVGTRGINEAGKQAIRNILNTTINQPIFKEPQQTTTQQQTNITNMEEKINESVETPQEEPQTVTPLEEVSDDARHQMYRTWNAKTIAARALRIAKMFSDEVTDIEMKLPMGEKQLSSFDTRTYIITKGVGAQKIFERIKKKIADTYANPKWARQTLSEVYGDIESHPEEFQKKVDYMVQQGNYMLEFFEPLCLEANNEIKQNESTSIFSKDGDVISVAEEEIEEFEEAISKHDEGWANKVHERSAEETLDREIRLLLANIYELDDEGYYTRLDDLEEPVPYGFGYVHSTLLNIVSKVTSDVAMMPTLKKNVAKFPWIQQVINLIGGQDTNNVTIYNGLSEAERKAKALSLQALFWKGMHKIHVNIATQTLETENEGGEAKIVSRIVNSPEGEEAALRGYENVCYTSKTLYDNGNPYKHVYNPDGTFNSKVYNDMWTLWNNSAIKQEMFKWDGSHVPTQEDLETLTTVLRAFGIDTPLINIYDLINPSSDPVVRQEQAEKIVALNSVLSTGFYNAQRGNNNPLKRVSSKETPENIFDAFNVQYRAIARVFGDSIMGYEESSARFKLDNEDKKLYSHIFPNHISTIFNKLNNVDRVSEDEYKERLQKTYLSNWWFTSPDGRHIRNGWLRDCFNNPKLRRGIRLKSLKASMGRGYASEINAQAEITRLNEFFHGNHAIGKINFREYSVPAFSDTSENYFCRGRYYNVANAEQHNELLNNLADVLKQEMERRNVVIRRYQLIKEDLEAGRPSRIKPIAGWDISFKVEDGKLVPTLDKPNGTQFFFFPSINAREFSKEYNSLPVEDREEFIRSQVEKALNEEFQFYLKQFNEYGISQIPRSDYTIDIAGRTALVSNLKVQIVGTSSRLSKIENSLSKEAMTEDTFRSLLAQWKEEAIKVYPQLNTTAVDAIMANYNFSKDQVLIDKLQDFFENSFYANSQIIELTMRDPAFLGTPDKFQKRFKQFYSPVSTCYTCHYMVNENGDLELLNPDAPDSLVKTTEVSITLAEANLKPALSIDNIRAAIKAQYAKGRITRDQAIEIEKSLGELGSGIDIADAQCYRTLPSWKKCLNMIGKGSNLKVQQAIERLENGEWSYEDYNIVWQVFKPFVSSYYEVPSHLPEAEQFPQYTNISVPTQHKNSEFLLLAIYSKLSGVLQDSYKLKGLNKFMVDHGIDKAQFESAVKVGNQGSIDLKDCTTEEEVIATLEAATGLHGNMQADKEGNPDVLHRMPFSDWGISTAMPEHLLEHEKSSMGTQIMKIIMEDMPEEGCMINGVRKTRAQWLELYQAIFTQNLKEAFAEVDDTLTNTKKLAEYLKKQIYSQNKYSQDLIDHLEIGPDGNFKNPIIDPMLRSQFDSLCASLIRKEVTKRPFRMGALPQVASWGFEDKIQLRFQDNSGNLIYTKEEFEEKLKDEHVVTITVGDTVLSFHTWEQYQDYAKTNATRIKYMEVLLPLFDNNFSRNIQDAFIDKETGKFNHKLFNEKLSDKMKEALGYRVPSEAKHSMIPLYVKGFLPAQNSSCIVIPPEWIAISDSDNDGDKLYTLFYESEVIYDDDRIRADFLADGGNVSDAVQNTKKFQAYARRKKADPHYIKEIKRKEFETVQLDRIEGETDSQYQQRCDLASIASNGAAARNNKLLEMMNAVLQTEDNTQFILTPGGFPVIKRVTDKIKDLLGVTSDTASICNPAMRTIHQIRNMAGANLIPVYANYRALRPLMQLADLKLHPRCQVVINGNYSLPKDSKGHPTWSLSAYRNAVGEYITDNISNFLGCAVDNAKDPRLSFSGQSLLTAPISMMMINMGYTIEEAALFMMQPAVRDLVREYYLNNEEVQLKDLIANRVKEYTHNGTYTPECAYPNLTDLPNQLMEDQIKKDAAGVVPTESDDAVQLQVLNVLQKLLIASDALNNINTVTRANTQNGAASSESSRNKQRLLTISRMQTEVKRDDYPIKGAEALVPTIGKFNQDEDIKNSKIPMNAAFRFYGIDQIPEMFKHISLTFNALVDTVHSAAMNLTDRPTLPISTIDGLTNAVASYTLSSIDAFNRTNSYTGYRVTVMKLFPSILASIKRDNLIPDNMLINDLVANVTGNVYSKSLPFITLPKSTKRNQGAITNYRRAWESLYENGDTEIKVKWNNQIIPLTYRDVANFLLSYCFFTNGMNAGGNSFISCFPKGRIPEIEGYVNALRSLERGTSTDAQTILDQYVANHPEDSTFTTRISVADFNKAIKTEKGIPTRIIVDTINSQDNKTLETFTVKDTVSKARKAHPYIFVTDGKGVRYLYKGYSYDDRVVYYRCEVLGNTSSKYLEEYQKGKSIAYERADGIKSIIPSNNPNTILTSEVSTGIEAIRSTGQGVTLDDVRTIVSNLLSPDATKASVKVQDFNEQTNDLTGVEFCVII